MERHEQQRHPLLELCERLKELLKTAGDLGLGPDDLTVKHLRSRIDAVEMTLSMGSMPDDYDPYDLIEREGDHLPALRVYLRKAQQVKPKPGVLESLLRDIFIPKCQGLSPGEEFREAAKYPDPQLVLGYGPGWLAQEVSKWCLEQRLFNPSTDVYIQHLIAKEALTTCHWWCEAVSEGRHYTQLPLSWWFEEDGAVSLPYNWVRLERDPELEFSAASIRVRRQAKGWAAEFQEKMLALDPVADIQDFLKRQKHASRNLEWLARRQVLGETLDEIVTEYHRSTVSRGCKAAAQLTGLSLPDRTTEPRRRYRRR